LPDLGGWKYLVIHKLGSGGMGTVYLAQDVDLGRKVAVKVMNEADPNAALASRMTREARIVALLEHPSIVPIHDVGVLDDGRVFYAMKLVQGKRLDEFATGAGSLSDLLRIFQKVCEAKRRARAMIHRDLSPRTQGPFGGVAMHWGGRVPGDGAADFAPDTGDGIELRPADADPIATLPLAGGLGDTSGDPLSTPAYGAGA
jgi:serine/threonine-protein kinase